MSSGGGKKIKETAEAKELARVSAEKWNSYVNDHIPFENEFIRRIEVTDQDKVNFKGQITSGVNSAFADATSQEQQRQFNSGIKPGSGRYNKAMERVMKKHGQSLGYSQIEAEKDMDQREVDGLEAAVSIGRGKEAESFRGLGQMASDAHSRSVSDAKNAITKRDGNMNAIGAAIGGYVAHNNNGGSDG